VFGQRAFAHVGDRLIIDHVIAVTGAQQFEEVEAALGIRVPNQVKCSLPSWMQKPLAALWRAPLARYRLGSLRTSPKLIPDVGSVPGFDIV
jgi:hypothetical protein